MKGHHFAGKRARILWRARSDRHARRAIAHLARDAGAKPLWHGNKLVAWELPDGFISCEKRRYRDQAQAQAELAGTAAFAHLQTRKIPVRAYPCPACKGWHVTSRR